MNLKRFLLLTALPFCCSSLASAQYVEYFKTYGRSCQAAGGRCVTRTQDGNIMLVAPDTSAGATDLLIVKTNISGDTLWTKRHSSPGMVTFPGHVEPAGTGDLLISGYIRALPRDSPAVAMLMRIDNQGSIVWQRQYRRSGSSTLFNDMKQTTGGYALCGTIGNGANGGGDAWLLKTDLNGDTLWSRSYGGANYDDSWQIEQTPDGGFLLGGGSYSYRTGTRHDDAWLVKTSATGAQQWIKHYGVADTVDWIWSMTPATNNGVVNGYVFTGVKNFDQNRTTSDLFLAKVDTAGNLLWDKSISGTRFRQGFAIEEIPGAGFYIAATDLDQFQGFRLLMIRTDTAGNVTNQLFHGSQLIITPRSLYMNNLGDAFVTGVRNTLANENLTFLARIRDVKGVPSYVPPAARAGAGITVYPNPATDGCTVESAAEPILRTEVCDAAGRILLQEQHSGVSAVKLNLYGLPRGLVFVRVYTRGIAPVTLPLTLQ